MPILNTDAGREGVVDIPGAIAELAKLPSIRNVDDRRLIADTVTAAALLDIAWSLRAVGAESRDALNLQGIVDALERDEPEQEADRDFFVEGDLVHVVDDTEPGEIVKLGFDQGEAYADVAFANGHADRYYLRNLVRIVGDEPDEEIVEAAVELVDTALELTDPAPLGEADLDNDFDVESDSAIVDPALEALRKATGGKKKGKKS